MANTEPVIKVLPRNQRAPKTSRLGLASFIIFALAVFILLVMAAAALIPQGGDGSDDTGLSFLIGYGALMILPGVLSVVFGHIGAAHEKSQGWKSRLTLTGLIGGYVIVGLWVLNAVMDVILAVFIIFALGLMFGGAHDMGSSW